MDKAFAISKIDNKGLTYEDFIDSCIFCQSQKGVSNFLNRKIESFHSKGKFSGTNNFQAFWCKIETWFYITNLDLLLLSSFLDWFFLSFPEFSFWIFWSNPFCLCPNYANGLAYLVLDRSSILTEPRILILFYLRFLMFMILGLLVLPLSPLK